MKTIVQSLLAAVLAFGLSTTSAHAQVPPVDTLVFEDGEFIIAAPIVVGAGQRMVIRNATVWLDAPRNCPARGTVTYCQGAITLLEGELLVTNSTIDSHIPYVPGDAYSGITINGFGTSKIDADSSTFRNLRALNFELGLNDGAPRLSTITNSLFQGGLRGPNFHRGTRAHITGNRFESVDFAIRAADSKSIIKDNFITDAYRAIYVESSTVGQEIYDGTTVIEDNEIEDSFTGVLSLSIWPNVISNNVVRTSEVGLVLGVIRDDDDETATVMPIVELNELKDNLYSIFGYMVGSTAGAEAMVMKAHNNSLEATCTDVYFPSDNLPDPIQFSFDATNNWWGSASGPTDTSAECPATTGNVITDPWLTAPPA